MLNQEDKNKTGTHNSSSQNPGGNATNKDWQKTKKKGPTIKGAFHKASKAAKKLLNRSSTKDGNESTLKRGGSTQSTKSPRDQDVDKSDKKTETASNAPELEIKNTSSSQIIDKGNIASASSETRVNSRPEPEKPIDDYSKASESDKKEEEPAPSAQDASHNDQDLNCDETHSKPETEGESSPNENVTFTTDDNSENDDNLSQDKQETSSTIVDHLNSTDAANVAPKADNSTKINRDSTSVAENHDLNNPDSHSDPNVISDGDSEAEGEEESFKHVCPDQNFCENIEPAATSSAKKELWQMLNHTDHIPHKGKYVQSWQGPSWAATLIINASMSIVICSAAALIVHETTNLFQSYMIPSIICYVGSIIALSLVGIAIMKCCYSKSNDNDLPSSHLQNNVTVEQTKQELEV